MVSRGDEGRVTPMEDEYGGSFQRKQLGEAAGELRSGFRIVIREAI